MPRVYLTNDSYPELRDVPFGWARSVTWWRAIRHAGRHRDFLVFLASQLVFLLGLIALGFVIAAAAGLGPGASRIVHILCGGAALGVFGYLQVSWGGDMMRRHLRAVSEIARYACPGCGHSLFGHLQDQDERPRVRCPECAEEIEREVFDPPYRVPRRFHAFPPRIRAPHHGTPTGHPDADAD